jgi:putative hydrolase of the HAD superfamily
MTDSSKLSRVSAIVFDLDDTLFDVSRWNIAALRFAGRMRGLNGNAVDAAIDAYLEEHGAPDAGIYNEVLLRSLQPDSGGAIRALVQAANRYSGSGDDWELFPGVREAMLDLSRRYRLALIAEGPVEAQKAKVNALGLQRLLRTVVYSDLIDGVRSRLPDPRPFREMRDRLELPSNQILFVADNPATDFETPNYLGFVTCRVLTGVHRVVAAGEALTRPDFELTSVARLPQLMAGPQLDISDYLHLPFLKQPESGSAPLLHPESLPLSEIPAHPDAVGNENPATGSQSAASNSVNLLPKLPSVAPAAAFTPGTAANTMATSPTLHS